MGSSKRIMSAPTPGVAEKFPFRHGRGRVIVKDWKYVEKLSDSNTYILETVIKSSSSTGNGTPNAPGERADTIEQLSKKGADSRVKGIVLALLGPDLGGAPNADAEVDKSLRIPEGGRYSDESKPSPVRGLELEYFTVERDFTNKETGAKEPGVAVRFKHVPFDAETVKANRKFLEEKGY